MRDVAMRASENFGQSREISHKLSEGDEQACVKSLEYHSCKLRDDIAAPTWHRCVKYVLAVALLTYLRGFDRGAN